MCYSSTHLAVSPSQSPPVTPDMRIPWLSEAIPDVLPPECLYDSWWKAQGEAQKNTALGPHLLSHWLCTVWCSALPQSQDDPEREMLQIYSTHTCRQDGTTEDSQERILRTSFRKWDEWWDKYVKEKEDFRQNAGSMSFTIIIFIKYSSSVSVMSPVIFLGLFSYVKQEIVLKTSKSICEC